jgi:histidyl-tRNA synthetase
MIDLSGTQMRRLRHVEDCFSDLARTWGFEEIRTPLIEHLHLYTRAGTLSPQLLGRVYSFLDWDGWSGERVVLRPDSTVAVARLYGERYAGEVKRLFYAQPVLRFAAADERRESWQVGAEVIGAEDGDADAELVLMAQAVLDRLGVRADLYVSHSGVLRALLARTGWQPAEQSAAYDRILDGDASAIAAMSAALPGLELGMKLLFDSEGSGAGYLANLKASLPADIPELAEGLSSLTGISEALTSAGVAHRIISPLARDFEYYTGLVFQFRLDGRVLGGGGRYDNLALLVTGKAAPACGYAFDSETLAELIEEPDTQQRRVALLAEGKAMTPAVRLLRALAASGVPASLNPPSRNGLMVRVEEGAYRRGDSLTPASDEGIELLVRQLAEEMREAT